MVDSSSSPGTAFASDASPITALRNARTAWANATGIMLAPGSGTGSISTDAPRIAFAPVDPNFSTNPAYFAATKLLTFSFTRCGTSAIRAASDRVFAAAGFSVRWTVGEGVSSVLPDEPGAELNLPWSRGCLLSSNALRNDFSRLYGTPPRISHSQMTMPGWLAFAISSQMSWAVSCSDGGKS